MRDGWSVRQLDRQINSLFYERIALSRNKAKMLAKSAEAKAEDAITPEEESKIRTCWNFSDSRMNTLSPKLKKRSFCISNGSC